MPPRDGNVGGPNRAEDTTGTEAPRQESRGETISPVTDGTSTTTVEMLVTGPSAMGRGRLRGMRDLPPARDVPERKM